MSEWRKKGKKPISEWRKKGRMSNERLGAGKEGYRRVGGTDMKVVYKQILGFSLYFFLPMIIGIPLCEGS